jgi:O-antigen/teichoic acid export membrane protein
VIRTRANIVANFAGRFWGVALSLLLIPAYIKLVGSEGYGFIGFFATVQVLVTIFDFGASTTVSREMARFSADPARTPDAPSLVRTMELPYWGIGAVLGIGMAAGVPLLARGMKTALPVVEVERALWLMALVIALQWPLTFYAGGIMGLQRQALWNAVNAAGATLRGAGAVAVLLFVSPTVTAFFTWQAIAAALHSGAAALTLWAIMPRTERPPRFELRLLKCVYRFALAVSGMSIVIAILLQLDRVVLIRVVPLAAFGEYALAASLAMAILIVGTPVCDAYLPRLAQHVARHEYDEAESAFHSFSQLVTVVTAPMSALLIFFARPVLAIWTRDAALASRVEPILMLLAAAWMLNVSMGTLDILQEAYGWLRPAVYVRAFALVGLGPAMVWACIRYGSIGAAVAWLVICATYTAATPFPVFRRLMPKAMLRWFVQDVGAPLGAALAAGAAVRLLVQPPEGDLAGALYLATAGASSFAAAALAAPACRAFGRRLLASAVQRSIVVAR